VFGGLLKPTFLFVVVMSLLTSFAFAQKPKTARKYFEELRDAGGFTTSTATTDGLMKVKNEGYVCFNEDSSSYGFFSFTAMTYDEKYNKVMRILTSKPTEEVKQQALVTFNVIISRDVYLQHIDEQILNIFPAPIKKFFLDGNQLMDMTSYVKGVKLAERELHRTKDDALSSGPWTAEKSRLNIEPSTLRYMLFNGDTVSGGKCEKVFPD
jgi:hypothetical protein